jgi:hypothetical protein
MQGTEKHRMKKTIAITLLVGSFLALAFALCRVVSIETSLQQYSINLASLKAVDPHELQQLEEQIQALESQTPAKENMPREPEKRDGADIGTWARTLFDENGLITESYRTSKKDDRIIFEFTVTGTIHAFVTTLQKAAKYENSPKILNFRLTAAPDGKISSTIRIGYE